MHRVTMRRASHEISIMKNERVIDKQKLRGRPPPHLAPLAASSDRREGLLMPPRSTSSTLLFTRHFRVSDAYSPHVIGRRLDFPGLPTFKGRFVQPLESSSLQSPIHYGDMLLLQTGGRTSCMREGVRWSTTHQAQGVSRMQTGVQLDRGWGESIRPLSPRAAGWAGHQRTTIYRAGSEARSRPVDRSWKGAVP